MLENSTLTCRMWRIHQRNISTDLQEDIFIDQNKYELYFWSYMAISTLFGNSFLGIIWHFERFGGDTQKRSLQNRLASQIIVACILLMNSANILGANMSYRFASYEVLMLSKSTELFISYSWILSFCIHWFYTCKLWFGRD